MQQHAQGRTRVAAMLCCLWQRTYHLSPDPYCRNISCTQVAQAALGVRAQTVSTAMTQLNSKACFTPGCPLTAQLLLAPLLRPVLHIQVLLLLPLPPLNSL
jgi:cell division inhibitor SulA